MSAATDRAPFLAFDSFTVDAQSEMPSTARSAPPSRSPFLSVYELEHGEDPQTETLRETYALLMNELDDEEFDAALFELQCRGRAMHDAQLALGKPRGEADRVVGLHFARLTQASQDMVDAMARELGGREPNSMLEQEIDTYAQGYSPPAQIDPEFEEFFGKIVRKVAGAAKTLVKKGLAGVTQLALGPALNLIKGAIKPILKRVLEWAIGKLPAALQPIAHSLAQKLGFAKTAPAAQRPAPDAAATADAAAVGSGDVDAAIQAAAGADAPTPQEEMNAHLASAMLAGTEAGFELEAAQLATPGAVPAPATFAELDDARERFIRELEELGDNESAEPHIQNFLPAILPALRLGLRLAGRQRVVNFLGGLLAKLIGKLVGPQHAPALGRAIADAGLKLMSLEMSETEGTRIAPAAVAATIEETVGRVAALPQEVLDDQELLEGYALEAFERAAAANLPAIFADATYRRRPDLLEGGVNAGWVLLPLRGPKRYKRCTRTFKVSVTPHLAEAVQSFEGASIADYLQDQLGFDEGEQVEAQLHLYEALPGTTLADIARGEHETLGPGLTEQANMAQLHPLTPQAATALLGKPGLGRATSLGLLRRHLGAGQRFYHMALGRRPFMVGHHRRPRIRHAMHVNLTLDAVQDQIRLCLFLSEVKAQQLAARLRQGANLGQVTAGLQRMLGKRLQAIFQGHAPRRLRLVHASLPPGSSPAAAWHKLAPTAVQAFSARLQGWLVQGLAEQLRTQTQKVIAATEDAADGITLACTLEHPPGLKLLGQALLDGNATSLPDAMAAGTAPMVRVEVHPGHRCG